VVDDVTGGGARASATLVAVLLVLLYGLVLGAMPSHS
jgi:hypothetical protein